MKNIKVMPDYQCHPLWDMSPGMYGDIDPSTLPISQHLRQEFADWAKDFDNTLNKEDPAASGFQDERSKADFRAKGASLAARLRAELGPDFSVYVKL